MDINKLIPWYWFKAEKQEEGKTMPLKRGTDQALSRTFYPSPLSQIHQEVDRIFENAFPIVIQQRLFYHGPSNRHTAAFVLSWSIWSPLN